MSFRHAQASLAAALLWTSLSVQASEWSGTMSCGELQNAPNADNQKPFTRTVRMTVVGDHAVIERQWPTGQERIEGVVQKGRPLELEGRGWFFNNVQGAWRTVASLTPIGTEYKGTAVIGSKDRQTKYRECEISLARSGSDSPKSTISDTTSPLSAMPQERATSFWDALLAKASNIDEQRGVHDARQLIEGLNDPALFRCGGHRSNILLKTAEASIEVSLPNVPEPNAPTRFESLFRQFASLCPTEVSGGKMFLDKLAKVLGEARNTRVALQQKERIAKEQAAAAAAEGARVQREQARAAEGTRRDAEARARSEAAKERGERTAAIKAGKASIDTFTDATDVLHPRNGLLLIINPPLRADNERYALWGVLDQWNQDVLVGTIPGAGPNATKYFAVILSKQTKFLSGAETKMRSGFMFKVIGRFVDVQSAGGPMYPVIAADYVAM